MIENKQSGRSPVTFHLTWAFLILTELGILLYVVLQGCIAHWVLLALLDLNAGTGVQRLAENGNVVEVGDRLRESAGRHEMESIDVLKLLLKDLNEAQ